MSRSSVGAGVFNKKERRNILKKIETIEKWLSMGKIDEAEKDQETANLRYLIAEKIRVNSAAVDQDDLEQNFPEIDSSIIARVKEEMCFDWLLSDSETTEDWKYATMVQLGSIRDLYYDKNMIRSKDYWYYVYNNFIENLKTAYQLTGRNKFLIPEEIQELEQLQFETRTKITGLPGNYLNELIYCCYQIHSWFPIHQITSLSSYFTSAQNYGNYPALITEFTDYLTAKIQNIWIKPEIYRFFFLESTKKITFTPCCFAIDGGVQLIEAKNPPNESIPIFYLIVSSQQKIPEINIRKWSVLETRIDPSLVEPFSPFSRRKGAPLPGEPGFSVMTPYFLSPDKVSTVDWSVRRKLNLDYDPYYYEPQIEERTTPLKRRYYQTFNVELTEQQKRAGSLVAYYYVNMMKKK